MTRTPAGAADGSLRTAIFRDYRSHWDGVVQKLCHHGRAERSVSPGEIAVFTPTGNIIPIEEEYETRGGVKRRTVEAVEYRRTSTRLV